MWLRRRVEIYNPKDDLTAIIQRLMSMDEKLDELLGPAEEDEDDEEDEV